MCIADSWPTTDASVLRLVLVWVFFIMFLVTFNVSSTLSGARWIVIDWTVEIYKDIGRNTESGWQDKNIQLSNNAWEELKFWEKNLTRLLLHLLLGLGRELLLVLAGTSPEASRRADGLSQGWMRQQLTKACPREPQWWHHDGLL